MIFNGLGMHIADKSTYLCRQVCTKLLKGGEKKKNLSLVAVLK